MRRFAFWTLFALAVPPVVTLASATGRCASPGWPMGGASELHLAGAFDESSIDAEPLSLSPEPTYAVILAGGWPDDPASLQDFSLGPELRGPGEGNDAEPLPPPAEHVENKADDKNKDESETDSEEEEAEHTLKEQIVLPYPIGPLKLWSGRVELGLNGADGNSQNLNTRSSGELVRKTPRNELTFNVTHNFARSESTRTADKLLYDTRFEKLFQASCWLAFVHNSVEYDDFQAFDSRVGFDGGIGYQCMKTDTTSLRGRVGAGASREYGVPGSRYIPEGNLSCDFEHKLSPGHKLVLKSEYLPNLEEFEEFRAKNDLAIETGLDLLGPMSLKMGVVDQYDSTPNGKKHNDVQYTAQVVWDF
jgi:putative salt-induced outer membrane protein YdiY